MYIGIDLGTSNSVIAGIIDGEARVFRPADGGDVLPSVIYVDKRGHRLLGRRAYDQALIAPDNVASGFKRLMGTATPIEIKGAGLALTPEECSAEIIRQLLGQATTETGVEKFDGAIITIPAAFDQMQAEATLRAARMAGLDKVDLLQEPVAAALASMAGAKRNGKFLIYDLGGGTFDVALAEAVNGEVSIIAHQGINMLGGRDFDRFIVNEIVRPWLAANFDLPDNFQRDKNFAKLVRVALLAAEKAKIDLSTLEEASIFASDDEVRLLDQSETEIFLDAPITRAQFEELIRKPVLQTVDLIRTIMAENNVTADDIDRIVFIGGPSRTPLIRQLVAEQLGIAADLKTDPMTAVAVGAAHYAESRAWGAAPQAGQSAPKPTAASQPAPAELGLRFDYQQRTPDDKTIITLRLDDAAPQDRQLRLTSKDWDSGILPLTDALTIMVPLKQAGEHRFKAEILDAAGQPLPHYDDLLTITRVVASAKSIPAAQTIAIKVLDKPNGQVNTLLPLVEKGTALPAQGSVQLQSAMKLSASEAGAISFELFQVEYPERIELNLCVGVFRIMGGDLPANASIAAGDPVIFDWRLSEGGILQATVRLPQGGVELKVPRFYAPQAGQISFAPEQGVPLAENIIRQGQEEWGEVAAALGPDGGPEMQLLRVRLTEQQEILEESGTDAETVRRILEESRFIRQDIGRLSRRHHGAMLQRRLGKLTINFNRIARQHAKKDEAALFDQHAAALQAIIDDGDAIAWTDGDQHLAALRELFFAIAWRDPDYVHSWFTQLAAQPFLFADQEEFHAMVAKGQQQRDQGNRDGFRELVKAMLEARIALTASDTATEPATLVKV
jgi:molecular chaperone DnaK